jgi:hypothetical protein
MSSEWFGALPLFSFAAIRREMEIVRKMEMAREMEMEMGREKNMRREMERV